MFFACPTIFSQACREAPWFLTLENFKTIKPEATANGQQMPSEASENGNHFSVFLESRGCDFGIVGPEFQILPNDFSESSRRFFEIFRQPFWYTSGSRFVCILSRAGLDFGSPLLADFRFFRAGFQILLSGFSESPGGRF